MRLTVLLPTQVLIDVEVSTVVAEAQNGFFGLLPQHIDFVAALVPGILSFTDRDGRRQHVAVDEGLLVKCGPEVRVSVLNAVLGTGLDDLRETVASRFRQLDDEQRSARTALSRLEAGALRRFLDLEEHARGR
ncbi:MAG TPA: F0F1 ATP synthase subunit epsilon [Vicinamibacterales bacterium]|nr:F0F1 ATP synthase subunit epsilon [Vicinamibacterales bacterium]